MKLHNQCIEDMVVVFIQDVNAIVPCPICDSRTTLKSHPFLGVEAHCVCGWEARVKLRKENKMKPRTMSKETLASLVKMIKARMGYRESEPNCASCEAFKCINGISLCTMFDELVEMKISHEGVCDFYESLMDDGCMKEGEEAENEAE